MFREMRRKDRQMSDEDTKALLKKANYGILSTVGKDNIPYGVPLSYAYADDVIYLHGATEGHKLDNIANNNNVCFTVVDTSFVELLPSEFSTKYKSVVVFGTVSVLEDMEEKQKGLEATINKLSPDFYDSGMKYINDAIKATTVFKIEINKMTGKAKLG